MIADAFDHLVTAGGAFRADVIAVNADGSVLVSAPTPDEAQVVCDRLYTGPAPLHSWRETRCSVWHLTRTTPVASSSAESGRPGRNPAGFHVGS